MVTTRNLTNIVRTAILVGILIVCGSISLYGQAQAFTATLAGTVHDASGAVVPNAKVALANPERGFARSFTTGPSGTFVFPLLPPGTYTLSVAVTGFKTYSQKGIVLTVGQSASLDVSLQVGAQTQQVTVSAGAPILNTANANIASTVTNRQVMELPLNLRNPFGLVFLNSAVNNSSQNQVLNAPGSQGTADQDITFFNFGGGYFGTAAFLLDGDWDTGGDWGGTVYVPSVDNTEEFKIQTQAYTAQYGWSTSNVVNAITKSGTNTLHGDAYEFVRNSAWDANNFFNDAAGISIPQFARNQFGIALGGPIYIPKLYEHRNKTFFFGDFEGLRQATPLTLTTTVPTAAMRSGDFSALLGPQIGTDGLGRPILSGQIYNPFTTRAVTTGQIDPVTGLVATKTGFIRDPFQGNNLTGMLNTVSKNFLQYWPSPTNSALVNNYTATGGAPAVYTDYSVRVDHNISDKSTMFARWSQRFEYKQEVGNLYGNDPGGPGIRAGDNRWDVAMNYNHIFGPTLDMSVNLGLARWVETNVIEGYPFAPSSLGLPSFVDASSPMFPTVTVDGVASLGSGGEGVFPRDTGSYSVDFTKIVGAHSLEMGYMGVDLQTLGGRLYETAFNFPLSLTQGPDPTGANPATGFGFASFMLGTGNSGSTGIASMDAATKKYNGWYLQDNWKATHKLTLNLGLRYDFQTGPTDRFNRNSWFNFNLSNPVSSKVGFNVPGGLQFVGDGNRRGVYEPQYTNFAPRIGLAYQLTHRLVMRSGFGLFYIPAYQLAAPLDGYTQPTPYVGTINGINPVDLISNPFPSGFIQSTGRSLGALTEVGNTADAVENYEPTPYDVQWMFDVQYQISPNNMIDVAYSGNHGVKLPLGSYNFDQVLPQDQALGSALLTQVANPFYGAITQSGCGLDQPTIPQGLLDRRLPEFCSVNGSQTLGGFSSYNALELTFNHRWSSGMQFLLSYTNSKFLDNTEGPGGWANIGNSAIRNYYDLSAAKSLDANDIPQSLVASYILQVPFGHERHFGSNASVPVNAVLGGWQVSGITTAKEGFPLSIIAASNNTNSFGGNQRPNLVGNPHMADPTIQEWFNTAAFAQPAAFTFGNVGRFMPNLRAPGYYDWDIGIEKWWHFNERVGLEFRGEMYDTFNHTNFYAPDQTFGSPGFGAITGAIEPRDIQFALKLYW